MRVNLNTCPPQPLLCMCAQRQRLTTDNKHLRKSIEEMEGEHCESQRQLRDSQRRVTQCAEQLKDHADDCAKIEQLNATCQEQADLIVEVRDIIVSWLGGKKAVVSVSDTS